MSRLVAAKYRRLAAQLPRLISSGSFSATPPVAAPVPPATGVGACACGEPVGTLRPKLCDDCAFDAIGGDK